MEEEIKETLAKANEGQKMALYNLLSPYAGVEPIHKMDEFDSFRGNHHAATIAYMMVLGNFNPKEKFFTLSPLGLLITGNSIGDLITSSDWENLYDEVGAPMFMGALEETGMV